MADGSRAGEAVHASTLLFPAATTTEMPLETVFATALSKLDEALPPKDKLTTARLLPLFAIVSSPKR
jgi:hypothetical protein